MEFPRGRYWVPLFLIYVNDLSSIISKKNNTMLFICRCTSVILTESNATAFNLHANLILNDINTWFRNNLLLHNLNKMQYLEFRTKKTCKIKGLIYYNNNDLSTVTNTKFLVLIIDDTLSWHQHVDSLTKRISSVSYA